MGKVYEAEAIRLDRLCAFKVLPQAYTKDDIAVKRFRREAKVVALVKHPHVVEIFDTGTTSEGSGYIAMEMLHGENLARTLRHEKRIPWPRARHIILQICRALAAAHAKHIVHRDMKPENCFRISQESDHDFIKVLDFGIAKLMDPEGGEGALKLTASDIVVGTCAYMAYEQISGQECDHRVDIWAVGVILYELLTGVRPFRGENQGQIWTSIVQNTPSPLRFIAPGVGIPYAVEAIVARALAKSRDARYPTIEALAHDLAMVDEDEVASASPVGLVPNHAGVSTKRMADVHSGIVAGAIDDVAAKAESADPHEPTDLALDQAGTTMHWVAPAKTRGDVAGPSLARFANESPQIAGKKAVRAEFRRMILAGAGLVALVAAGVMWANRTETPLTLMVGESREESAFANPILTKPKISVAAAVVSAERSPAVESALLPTPPPNVVEKETPKKKLQKTTTVPRVPATSAPLEAPPPPLPEKKPADHYLKEMAQLRDSAAMIECFTSQNARGKPLAVDVEIDADTGRASDVIVPVLTRGSALARCVEREIRRYRFSPSPGEPDYKVTKFALNK